MSLRAVVILGLMALVIPRPVWPQEATWKEDGLRIADHYIRPRMHNPAAAKFAPEVKEEAALELKEEVQGRPVEYVVRSGDGIMWPDGGTSEIRIVSGIVHGLNGLNVLVANTWQVVMHDQGGAWQPLLVMTNKNKVEHQDIRRWGELRDSILEQQRRQQKINEATAAGHAQGLVVARKWREKGTLKPRGANDLFDGQAQKKLDASGFVDQAERDAFLEGFEQARNDELGKPKKK